MTDSLSADPSPPVGATRVLRTGWASRLALSAAALLWFEAVTGLAVTFAPFHPAVQWGLVAHTVLGVLGVVPVAWYCAWHLGDYRRHPWSQVTLLGWVALGGLVATAITGCVPTVQALIGVRTSAGWREAHLVATWVLLAGWLPHLVVAGFRSARAVVGTEGVGMGFGRFLGISAGLGLGGCLVCLGLAGLQGGGEYRNVFPEDYSYLYGTNRPFAPSLARTDTGGAFDARSLAGSRSCGTAGCHEEIVAEWLPSAHRYAAMDRVFQGIQEVMAKQNGPESTRYCGGCHDPISLFSGTKNLFVENLTGQHGYQEGISCLACHAIRETDVKGNANYTVTQPREYLGQWATAGPARVLRDFLIRSYPEEHNRLAKRAFKKPEYCAACHKQFIDAEVNRVGWVQLQNQYDNWAASHWNRKGDPRKTVECRECHMPLVDSHDPAAGDALDYNRTPGDRKHRSHRFIAANTVIPAIQADQLEGAKEHLELTERWLRGEFPIPEIADKWTQGPIVKVALTAPETVPVGQDIPLRVVMTSNKVGHDFPTGPLDIIQSWLEVRVTDPAGREIWASGRRDSRHFLEPGTFLFKAEPVDQHGNLIDRHNLWEMVGVRFRRALFPGYSDAVPFTVPCSGAVAPADGGKAAPPGTSRDALEIPAPAVPSPASVGEYQVSVSLNYRKIDQFLLNYLFGDTNRLTSPVTEIAGARATVRVVAATGDVTPGRASLPAVGPTPGAQEVDHRTPRVASARLPAAP